MAAATANSFTYTTTTTRTNPNPFHRPYSLLLIQKHCAWP